MATTRLLLNTTDEAIVLKEHGELEVPAHQHVSIHTDYHQPILLENYPGLIDATDLVLDADEDGNLTVRQETPASYHVPVRSDDSEGEQSNE